MSSVFQTQNRIIEVIRRGQRGTDGDVGLVTTVTKSADFTAVTGERGYAYVCNAALTASFEAAATLTNGWHCIIDAVGGDVILDPNGAETINGVATLTVTQNASALVYTDGTALYARFFFGSAYTALNGLPTAADKYIYGTGPGVWTEGDITAAGRALLDDATASDQLTTLGVSTFAKTLLDDADAAAARATLGVGLVPIARLEGNNTSPNLDFTGFDATEYEGYIFELHNVIPAGDSLLRLRVSTDGGSTYDSGSFYRFGYNIVDENGGNIAFNSSGSTGITLCGDAVGGATLEYGWSGTVKILAPANAQNTIITVDGAYADLSNELNSIRGAGVYTGTATIDAVRFLFSSQNIESGSISHYGIVQP